MTVSPSEAKVLGSQVSDSSRTPPVAKLNNTTEGSDLATTQTSLQPSEPS